MYHRSIKTFYGIGNAKWLQHNYKHILKNNPFQDGFEDWSDLSDHHIDAWANYNGNKPICVNRPYAESLLKKMQ